MYAAGLVLVAASPLLVCLQVDVPLQGLEDYLQHALAHNPGLQAALHRSQAAQHQVNQARSLPDPRVSYRYFLREVETRVGAQRQALEITQAFPWPGKRDLAGRAAAEAAEAASQQYEAVRQELLAQVKEAYFEFYYLARSIEVTQAHLGLLAGIEAVARTRYQTGSSSQAQLLRIQVELDRLQDRLNTLCDMLGPARARLNALLNRPVDADLPLPGQCQPTRIELDDRELIGLLEQASPRIKVLDHMARSEGIRVRLARRQYEPDIMLGLGIVDVAATSMSKAFPDSGRNAVSAMVSLNIPIWSGRIDSAVRQAQMARQSTVQDRLDLANQLKARLAAALVRLRDARRRLDLYTNGLLPRAMQALEVSQEAFRAGTADLTDVLDAERTYLEFQLANQRALADHEQALGAIEDLVGRQLAGSADKETVDGR